MKKKYDVFISFCSKDGKVLPNKLHSILTKKYNLEVFYSEQNLQTGVLFKQVINEAVLNSTIGIVLLSENYKLSVNCISELNSLSKNSILFPVIKESEFETVSELFPKICENIQCQKYSHKNDYRSIATAIVCALIVALKKEK